jgi:hypothetical protein
LAEDSHPYEQADAVTKTEEFQGKAEECEARASEARNPQVKQSYQDLARQWRELATYAQRAR